MDSGDETIIALSKKKIVLILLGACVFVAAGVWMFSLDDASIQSGRRFNDPLYVHGLGLASIVFFGGCGLFALTKLFDKKPALVLTNSGFVDNSSSAAAGFIPWSEVVGTEIFEIQQQKMLVITVKNPEEYIARGNSLKRALNKANHKMVGSPISISSNALAINFSELVSLFDEYRRKYGVASDDAEMRRTLAGQDAQAWQETLEGRAGHDDGYIETDVEPEPQLLNWSPGAVQGTVGAGGLGILVLSLSSLDILFHIQIPFWVGFVISLLPMFIFFLATPDFLPHRIVRPAQWFAAIWYIVSAALSISLAASRGLESVEFLLIGFIVLGAWPCLVAVRKLRLLRET